MARRHRTLNEPSTTITFLFVAVCHDLGIQLGRSSSPSSSLLCDGKCVVVLRVWSFQASKPECPVPLPVLRVMGGGSFLCLVLHAFLLERACTRPDRVLEWSGCAELKWYVKDKIRSVWFSTAAAPQPHSSTRVRVRRATAVIARCIQSAGAKRPTRKSRCCYVLLMLMVCL